jgi:hypothetical protein
MVQLFPRNVHVAIFIWYCSVPWTVTKWLRPCTMCSRFLEKGCQIRNRLRSPTMYEPHHAVPMGPSRNKRTITFSCFPYHFLWAAFFPSLCLSKWIIVLSVWTEPTCWFACCVRSNKSMLHYVWNRFQSLYESLLDHIVHGLRRQQTHPAFIYSIQSVCGVAFIYSIQILY